MKSAADILRHHSIDYVVTKSGKYTTKCSACGEGYLNVKVDKDGVAWYCHHCQEGGGEKFDQSEKRDGGLGPIKAIYDYTDEHGARLFQVLRFEPIGRPKDFRQRTGPDQDKWSIKGARIVPFMLPDLLAALGENKTVFVVEGEKDVLTLQAHNVPATCSPMGASKWRTDFGAIFGDADVVICGNNDEPGRDHVRDVARKLHGFAKRIRVLDLAKFWPEIKTSEDISDWFAAGHAVEQLWEIVDKLEDWKSQGNGHDGAAHNTDRAWLPPLTIPDWLSRDLPEPDWLMGHWLSTTSRVLLVAATGLGKSNLGLAVTLHVAAGVDFLHWQVTKPRRALFIDGEMSRRLLKKRIADATNRLGEKPPGFFALSHEDIEKFAPLNTRQGQAQVENIVKAIGGIDLIVFDAIMSLTAGDMKENAPWTATLPWVRTLTKANIGQIWVHHTGHDESRSYGDKSREWAMDCVIHLEQVKRDDTDVSFQLEFKKAREREPSNREDFADARVALVGDKWTSDTEKAGKRTKITPLAQKFLDALVNVLAGGATMVNGRRSASREQWKAECEQLGLLDPGGKPDAARSLFSKYRLELIAANRIACDEKWSWLV